MGVAALANDRLQDGLKKCQLFLQDVKCVELGLHGRTKYCVGEVVISKGEKRRREGRGASSQTVIQTNPVHHSPLVAKVSSLIRCFSIFAIRVGRDRPSILAARDLFPPFKFRASVMSMAENSSIA